MEWKGLQPNWLGNKPMANPSGNNGSPNLIPKAFPSNRALVIQEMPKNWGFAFQEENGFKFGQE